MAAVYVAVVLGFGVFEGRSLFKEKKWFELTVFCGLLFLGLTVIVIDTLSYSPWRISRALKIVVEPLFAMVRYWLLKVGAW